MTDTYKYIDFYTEISSFVDNLIRCNDYQFMEHLLSHCAHEVMSTELKWAPCKCT
jgi:hypothetical protein